MVLNSKAGVLSEYVLPPASLASVHVQYLKKVGQY